MQRHEPEKIVGPEEEWDKVEFAEGAETEFAQRAKGSFAERF